MAELTRATIGLFRGFTESGLEFHADLLTPYAGGETPIIGSFLLVEIEPGSALVGRVARFRPAGVMASTEGDDYLATMSRLQRPVPEELKEAKLRYSVDLRLLGIVRNTEDGHEFAPAIRRLPHLGSPVGIPTDELLGFLCSIGVAPGPGVVEIGHLALGDIVFDGVDTKPALPILFDMRLLHARRTFVFARAGYGKSNLLKLLVARLYEQEAPGGTIIFDPEGEYAFTDQMSRPGLDAIPGLRERLVVFTDRSIPPPQSRWVQGRVRLDLGTLPAATVVGLTIARDKQETVFANRLRGMGDQAWAELIDLLHIQGYQSDDAAIGRLASLDPARDGVVINAIRSNLVPAVRRLHDPASDLQDAVLTHLAEGRIVVIDISLMGSTTGEQVAGTLMERIMHHNQRNFTLGSTEQMIPAVAVIEEAQSVLSPTASDTSPFVEWAKEGRKYQLGAVLVTQQPASIDERLLSQGDNFVAFHLIAEGDLRALQRVNAHFSTDVLSQLLNEPIPGNAYLWSAPDQPFVLPARIANFEEYATGTIGDADLHRTPAETYDETRLTASHRFAETVLATLASPSVRLCSVVLNGTKRPTAVATKEWNLRFAVAEQLTDDLRSMYGLTLDDGTAAVRLDAIVEAIKARGRIEEAKAGDGTPYLVLQASLVGQRSPSKEVSLSSTSV